MPHTLMQDIGRAVERMLLDRHAPACMIINTQEQIVYLWGSVGRYVQPAIGALPLDIVSAVRPSLSEPIRSAVRRSLRSREETVVDGLVVAEDAASRIVRLVVSPFPTTADEALFAVLFDEPDFPPKEKHTARLAAIVAVQAQAFALPQASLPSSDEVNRAFSILLVEDNADTAELLSELLELSGHRVTSASSVSGAAEIAQSHEFDLLISDLGLPDGTGIDVLLALRKAGKSPGAIVLSGYGMDEDRQRTARAGFHEHIVKPVTPDELLAAVGRVAKRLS
jgi:CheY-like chemotaxis protein